MDCLDLEHCMHNLLLLADRGLKCACLMVCHEEAGRREDGPLTLSVATDMEERRTKEGEAQTDMVNITFFLLLPCTTFFHINSN